MVGFLCSKIHLNLPYNRIIINKNLEISLDCFSIHKQILISCFKFTHKSKSSSQEMNFFETANLLCSKQTMISKS